MSNEQVVATPAEDGAEKGLLRSGTRIGHYELIGQLGRGGMGLVCLARDLKLSRRVAIKFLALSSGNHQQFLTEARATAACHHENIVVIHEIGTFGEYPYMVLEYLEGNALNKYIKGRSLTPSRVVELMVPVVRALVFAHEQGIVHRDLKMANIMVTRSGTVKVLDFGIATLIGDSKTVALQASDPQRGSAAESPTSEPDEGTIDFEPALVEQPIPVPDAETVDAPHEPGPAARQTHANDGITVASTAVHNQARRRLADPLQALNDSDHLMTVRRLYGSENNEFVSSDPQPNVHKVIAGTPSYMAPEQFGFGDGLADHRCDIWAAGIIMFGLLTSHHPLRSIKGADISKELEALDRPLPHRVQDFAPHVPRKLRDIVERCLQKRKESRFADAKALLDALEPLLPERIYRSLDQGQNPYLGLATFQEEDASRFFGRARETQQLLARLRERPLIGVVGASGVGKSSLIRAGLVPVLRSAESWEVITVRPGRRPLAALATQLTDVLDSDPLTQHSGSALTSQETKPLADPDQLARELQQSPAYLGRYLRAHAKRYRSKVLLFIDQFEELFTLTHDAGQRRAFVEALIGAADDPRSPLRVIVSLRADMLDRLTEHSAFADDLTRGLFLLSTPDETRLREALVEPLGLLDYRFDDQTVVADMLRVLKSTTGALPLMQFTASRLWEMRDRESRTLTRSAYDALGGIIGALASHADGVVERLPGSQQALLREIFCRLVTPERTRAVVDIDELTSLSQNDATVVRKVIDQLAGARLLVVQQRGESTTVEIVHESLISSWPALRGWLDANQEDSVFLARLRAAAEQWDAGGRRSGLLWRDESVEEAKAWSKRSSRALSQREQAFLNDAFALAARAARRRRLALGGLLAVMGTIAVASTVVALIVREAQEKAVKQASIAKREAERAKTAEQKIAHQLQLLKDKERQRQRALAQTRNANAKLKTANVEIKAASDKIKAASVEIAGNRHALKLSNAQLRVALFAAQRNSRVARTQSRKAKAAEGQVRKVNKKLRSLLAAERRRSRELAKERQKITTELR
jgi:serine/threonine protein kinase